MMKVMNVSLILACTLDGRIGRDNDIPWNISSEMKKFKKITTYCKDPNKLNAVVMGRKTWESIGRPLPNRLNIIITTNHSYSVRQAYRDQVIIVHSIRAAMAHCDKNYIENIFIIGGAELYNLFLSTEIDHVKKVYLSIIFYDKQSYSYNVNKFIDIDNIFKNFKLQKDIEYQNEADCREFASYICHPKNILHKNASI
jgi:dihydrofolate reductase